MKIGLGFILNFSNLFNHENMSFGLEMREGKSGSPIRVVGLLLFSR